jgi:3D (Asp-Asp-Asp) domain-containing protein
MVRRQLVGLFILFLTFIPVRLSYSKTNFPLTSKFSFPKSLKQQLPVFSHRVAASVYFPDEAQTDSQPLITADGSQIDREKVKTHRWIAVSRNLLKRWGGKLQYGDTLQVAGISAELDGIYIIRDTMNRRLKNTIDILVGRTDNIYGHWKNVQITKYKTVAISD